MTIFTKLTGRKAVVSCLPGNPVLCGSGLSGVIEGRLAERVTTVDGERATKAPTAAVAAQAPAYALAAKGAGLPQRWTEDGFATGTATASEHHTMRAFRGLPPWRDPA